MEQPDAADEDGAVTDMERRLIEIEDALEEQFKETGSLEHINNQIKLETAVVDWLPEGHPNRTQWLINLARSFGRRFDLTGSMTDLSQAIELAEAALEATTDEDSRPPALVNVASQLRRRYEITGLKPDIDRAIELAQAGVDGSLHDDPLRAVRLSLLGACFASRYDEAGSRDDLDRSIEIIGALAETTPQGDPRRIGYLTNFANRLCSRFEKTDSIDDLNRAIEIAAEAVEAAPEGHPHQYLTLNNLGIKLGQRYDRFGSLEDLTRAITALGSAKSCTLDHHVHRPAILVNYGNRLCDRYNQTSSTDDLNQGIDNTALGVEITPPGHSQLSDWSTSLAANLRLRFDRYGSTDDMNRAVEAMRRAVIATPSNHPRRAVRLYNLGLWLEARADRSGSTDDLNQAIEYLAITVEITAEDNPLDKALYRNSLAGALSKRFQRTGSVDDIVRAVETAEMVVSATPEGHANRASRSYCLSLLLRELFLVTRSMETMIRAAKMAGEAAASIPEGHTSRAAVLGNLGDQFGQMYEETGSMDHLNRAIAMANRAVAYTPEDHSHMAGWRSNLATWLGRRFDETGSMDDLNESIKLLDAAVSATPNDHPERAKWLQSLGRRLEKRHGQTGSAADPERALSLYMESWSSVIASPSDRIKSAQYAASILVRRSDWDEASVLLEEAVKILPAVSPRSLKHTDKQKMLANFSGLASLAAATALNAGKEASQALQVLELGRGIIAGLLLEMRTEVSDLQTQHSDLAEEFRSLRDELDSPPENLMLNIDDEIPSWEQQAKRRREADQKLAELLLRIRAKDGFRNFLLPPLTAELMAAAEPGPIVVVNLSRERCDAFLVETHRIRALQLTQLKLEEAQEKARSVAISGRSGALSQVSSTLEWLWNVVCRPCLDQLGFDKPMSDGSWPHVWWIPTGLLTRLPLHAAGCHAPGSTEAVLERVMSSYASSIKALVYGRRFRIHEPESDKSRTALLVSMPKTIGLEGNGDLPYADDEVRMLEGLCQALHLQSVKPKSSKDEVLKHLRGCKLFHFAGHGKSNPIDPSQSSLLLEDWESKPLTVGDIREYRLQENGPFLGYLSACWTGAIEADNLVDEGIHLANALQLAGFRHVVGTLWEVSDAHCVDVARSLYETIVDLGMTDTAVCLGLHHALRSLRDLSLTSGGQARDGTLLGVAAEQNVPTNLYWVPYVHYGV